MKRHSIAEAEKTARTSSTPASRRALNGKHYSYKESAIGARNPEKEADPFEKAVLMVTGKILELFPLPIEEDQEEFFISAMDELLEMTDQAMYAAKRGGKARFCLPGQEQLPPPLDQPSA